MFVIIVHRHTYALINVIPMLTMNANYSSHYIVLNTNVVASMLIRAYVWRTKMFVTLSQTVRRFSRRRSSHCRKPYEDFHEDVRHIVADRTKIFTKMFVTLSQTVRRFSRRCSSHCRKPYEVFTKMFVTLSQTVRSFHEDVRHIVANRTKFSRRCSSHCRRPYEVFTKMFVTLSQTVRRFSRRCSSHCRKPYEDFHEDVHHIVTLNDS